jgi:hypothetical protein
MVAERRRLAILGKTLGRKQLSAVATTASRSVRKIIAVTGLAIEIGGTVVAESLAAAGIEPAPKRETKRTWKRFIKAHWDSLYKARLWRP